MKKIVVLSTIMAVLVASLSAFSVFAAPSTMSRVWGAQLSELNADRAFYDHFVANNKNFTSVSATDKVKLQIYLARYASDLAQAEAIVKNTANQEPINTKGMTTAQVNRQDQVHQTAAGNLSVLLRDMRGIQTKLEQIG